MQNYGNSLIRDRFFPIFFKFAPKFNTTMKYYEAIFTIKPCTQDTSDILSTLAAEAGFESFLESEEGLKGYVQTDLFDRQKLDEIIRDFPIPTTAITYAVTEMEDKDWNEQWEAEGFDPIVINDRCIIYDARLSNPSTLNLQDSSLNAHPSTSPHLSIAIEACQAFGTGTHETTRMVVATLLEMDMKGQRVLDCGCGTGILGIVAKKLGAEEVIAYDIDDWSVKNTIHNAELNDVKIDVLEGDKSVLSHINGIFDIVTANINRNILLADMEAFYSVMEPNGKLILSGFYEADVPLLLERAAELDLHEISRKTDHDWCCLILGKL